MTEIISFSERRSARFRDRLATAARNGEVVVIETRAGPIRADRLICMESAAQILTSWGEKVAVNYAEIREVRASATPQFSTINDHGDFVMPGDFVSRTEPSRVLAFARPGRRR